MFVPRIAERIYVDLAQKRCLCAHVKLQRVIVVAVVLFHVVLNVREYTSRWLGILVRRAVRVTFVEEARVLR